MEYGLLAGEKCNRNGCSGIIEEREKEGGCSCHIHPPCSYCTTDTAFCPGCNWDCNDEPVKEVDKEAVKRNEAYYADLMKKHAEAEERFTKLFTGKEKAMKLEIRAYSHTNSSMLKKGVFPAGTETWETILPKVKGTFGGRFTRFEKDRGIFEYVAYTD